MTLHQRRTHPEPVEGCWACKASTLSFTGYKESKSETRDREKAWDQELALFDRATADGSLPKGTKTKDSLKALEYADRYSRPYRADNMTDTYAATSNQATEIAHALGEVTTSEARDWAGVEIP